MKYFGETKERSLQKTKLVTWNKHHVSNCKKKNPPKTINENDKTQRTGPGAIY